MTEIIGQTQKAQTINAKRAVAIMSEGFLVAMGFLKANGAPQDLMIEAMRIGAAHGLCMRKDGLLGPNGQPTIQYINPYAELVADMTPLADEDGLKPQEDTQNGIDPA